MFVFLYALIIRIPIKVAESFAKLGSLWPLLAGHGSVGASPFLTAVWPEPAVCQAKGPSALLLGM